MSLGYLTDTIISRGQ